MTRHRRAFHHGDLAAAAETEALALLESEGERAVTMRAVAARCGVAHRSLYRHFEKREALLSALAARGFDAVSIALSHSQSREDLIGVYGRFALKRPHLYGLMMTRPNAAIEADPRLRAAADKMIGHALRILAPDEAHPEKARRKVMRVWMALHGGVVLHAAGALKARNAAAFIDEMTAILGPEV
jgi:AcrR family transcriptional regulator